MKNVDVPSFKINGETIQEVDNVKYLGHFISNTLRDDKDSLRQCRQRIPPTTIVYARGNGPKSHKNVQLRFSRSKNKCFILTN